MAEERQSDGAADVGRGHTAEDVVNQGKGFKLQPGNTGKPLEGCKQVMEVLLLVLEGLCGCGGKMSWEGCDRSPRRLLHNDVR